jgi:hypothetical protein
MVCSNKGCKIKANIGARSGLCQSCETFVRNSSRRMEHQDNQKQARGSNYDAHRNLHDEEEHDLDPGAGPSHAGAPPPRNIFNYPSNSTEQALPEVDISEIIKSCEEAKKGNQVDTGKVLSDICGMMVHMFSKQNENEGIKTQVVSNTDRIEHLEAKIGDPNDVSYSRSIAIRKLPLPPHGVTELQNAQHYLKEIRAEAVDISKDAIKAVRKEAAKHNPNLGPNLGTVLVELRNEEIRGKIMKKKKDLEHHPTQLLKELIIKNALTPSEMKAQNTDISLLKMITGGNDHYVAGNGMIYQKNQNNPQQRLPQQHQPQPQAFRPPTPVQQTQQARPESRPQSHTQPQQNTAQFPPQFQQYFQRQHLPPQMPPFMSQYPQPPYAPYNFSFAAQPPTTFLPTAGNSGNPAPSLLDFDFPEAPDASQATDSPANQTDPQTDGRRTAHGQ